jgi:hypothetical protein
MSAVTELGLIAGKERAVVDLITTVLFILIQKEKGGEDKR